MHTNVLPPIYTELVSQGAVFTCVEELGHSNHADVLCFTGVPDGADKQAQDANAAAWAAYYSQYYANYGQYGQYAQQQQQQQQAQQAPQQQPQQAPQQPQPAAGQSFAQPSESPTLFL